MAERTTKTVLLVFIHGFKGDDSTFARFPTGISHALSTRLKAHESPQVSDFDDAAAYNVIPIVYPAFETRGSLQATVERFRAWLLEKVIDAEVARGTERPTVEPGVGVIIIGHSMGGIVGAEACLGIAGECFDIPTDKVSSEDKQKADQDNEGDPVNEAQNVPLPEDDVGLADQKPKDTSHAPTQAEEDEATQGISVDEETTARKQKQDEADVNVKGRLFPKIIGLLAFDTPFLGIAPGVIKHNAEEQWQQGKAWYDSASTMFAAGSTISSVFGVGKNKEQAAAAQAAANTAKKSGWGRTALMAGTGIATLAGGAAAAYAGKDHILGGFNWASSHLEFVGCLAKDADLRRRFGNMVKLSVPGDKIAAANESNQPPKETDTNDRKETIDFAVLYTLLAPVLGGDTSSAAGGRTFCKIPNEEQWQSYWLRAMNDKAKNEIDAHVTMFQPKENTHYEALLETSAEKLSGWIGQWA